MLNTFYNVFLLLNYFAKFPQTFPHNLVIYIEVKWPNLHFCNWLQVYSFFCSILLQYCMSDVPIIKKINTTSTKARLQVCSFQSGVFVKIHSRTFFMFQTRTPSKWTQLDSFKFDQKNLALWNLYLVHVCTGTTCFKLKDSPSVRLDKTQDWNCKK
jgi:hypothetical protein